MKASKPIFVSVIDLGLRDVGVRNDWGRLAARFGGTSARVLALGGILLALRIGRRAPLVVVKVTAEGGNKAAWLLIVPFLLLAVLALMAMELLLVPVAGLWVVMAVLVWRQRGRLISSLRLAVDELTVEQVPADGRSNLTGGAASLTYTTGPGLKEFIADEHWDAGPNDGARWELRSSFTKGENVVSLAHYVFDAPRLDDAVAVAGFVADKDREHSRIAEHRVRHTERVVDGRKGYVWTHRNDRGFWHYAAWFPQPVHTVRVECVAKRQERRFRRLCSEAIGSLRFH